MSEASAGTAPFVFLEVNSEIQELYSQSILSLYRVHALTKYYQNETLNESAYVQQTRARESLLEG